MKDRKALVTCLDQISFYIATGWKESLAWDIHLHIFMKR